MAVVPGWIALLTLYFLWIKRMLTYKLVARRDMLRASLLSGAVIVFIVVFSSWVMEYWIDLYAGDYGVFGVVIAIFFWIGFSSAVIVLAPLTGARRAAPSATPPRTAGPQPT